MLIYLIVHANISNTFCFEYNAPFYNSALYSSLVALVMCSSEWPYLKITKAALENEIEEMKCNEVQELKI